MEPTLDDILNYDSEYDVLEKVMDVKGSIVFDTRKIYINPMFNDNGLTYTHELFHHHYREIGLDVSEEIVERESQRFYFENQKEMDFFYKVNVFENKRRKLIRNRKDIFDS